MLTIRMRRVGAKKKPLFRVVVTEARTARDGAALEVLGHYNPTAQPEIIEVDRERLRYWTARGAQVSNTVRTLLARNPEGAAAPAAEVEAAAEDAPAVEAAAEAVPAAEAAAPEAPAEPAQPAETAAEPEAPSESAAVEEDAGEKEAGAS